MRKIYILFLVVFTMAQFNSSAQKYELPGDFWEWEINRPGFEAPALIFTEYRGDINNFSYWELTNVGTETLDLSNFSIISIGTYGKLYGSTDSLARVGHEFYYIPLEGTLEPGKSYVETNVWDAWNEDGLPNHNIAMLDVANRLHHVDEANTYEFLNKPEWQAYASDSVSFTHSQFTVQGSSGYYLEYKFKDAEGNRDSTLIDNVNISIDQYFKAGETENGIGVWGQGNYQTPVAGVTDAIDQYILVRKSTATQGNLDWHLARGTDLATSEWLPVPVSYNKFDLFTTVGVHGNFSLDYTAKNPDDVKVDVANKTITVPWATTRGETLNREFDLGPGMTWSYVETATDSAFSNAQNGDVFSLYAVGDDIEQLELTVNVQAAAADVAVVFPKRRLAMDEETGAVWWPTGTFYGVTTDLDQDSIYNLAFGTPIDTLFKYLDKPEKANWEVVTGEETRADLKDGDILKVTSENGSVVKEYLIQIDDYLASDNANLSLISWPDVDTDIFWDWTRGDTLPEFSPGVQSYFLKIPAAGLDVKQTPVPALQFKTEDVNAKIEVMRAVDMNGTIEQRTTTVYVTSESDTVTSTYKILFEFSNVILQPNIAEPFFSEFMMGMNFAYAVEIYNPGNQDLDLNRYMIVRGDKDDNLGTAVGRLVTNRIDYVTQRHYVPGMRFKYDTDLTAYQASPGFLIPDNVTNTIVKAGDVFVAGSINDGGWPGGRFYPDRYNPDWTPGHKLDFIWYGWSNELPDTSPSDSENDEFNMNPWGTKLHRYNSLPAYLRAPNTSLFLLKIMNDSILNGTKDVTDPNDYEIVDRWQSVQESDKFYLAGRDLTSPHWNGWTVQRKAHVWEGVTERAEGFGDDFGQSAENSDYTVFNSRDEGMGDVSRTASVGWHAMDPVLTYVSTVTSTTLAVTPGYKGNIFIKGDIAGKTVTEITQQLDKADPGQTLTFMNGTDTLVAADPVFTQVKVIVTSADGKNKSTYKLVGIPLSGDNLLVALNGSGLEVSLSDAEGVVAGVATDITVKALIEMLEVPSFAILNIIDSNNGLLPLQATDYDSKIVDVMVSPNVFLEVVAQNGDAVVYSLDFGTTSSDAMLFSNVLSIDQDSKVVLEVPQEISVSALMEIVYPNQKASIKVTDKGGFTRTSGMLNLDDYVVVTSEDGSGRKTYQLKFVEMDIVGNPVTSIDARQAMETNFNVYPNPVSGVLHIMGVEMESYQIYSITGSIVSMQKSTSNSIDVSELINGLYIIMVDDFEGRNHSSKFIKQ